jgi:processive 1,2-diacylglycerol beta-glucosyltransferase
MVSSTKDTLDRERFRPTNRRRPDLHQMNSSGMTRILLLHASVGMGHWRAATALAQAFAALPGTSTRIEDTLHYARELFRKSYAGLYLQIADHAPTVWSRFYAYTDRPLSRSSLVGGARALSTKLGVHRLCTLLADARPDAIICTHFLPLEVLGPLRQAELIPPLHCVVTDYRAHHFWAHAGIDRYFVPTAQTADELVAAGIPRTRVQVSGIPVDPAIHVLRDRIAVRHELGLPPDGALVLVNGGGLAPQRVRRIVEALLRRRMPGTLVVATGRNRALAAALGKLHATQHTRLQLLGPQPSLDPLIAASDLVIGKAGGLTVSEALGRGVPLIIPTPVPGQEQWNAAYVTRLGAGVCRDTAEGVAQAAVELLRDHQRRRSMAAVARTLGRPAAAAAIARRVLADASCPAPLSPAGSTRSVIAVAG